jgi:hypothetical protein
MCKKAEQTISSKPSHLQLGSFKLILPFNNHRYLKKVVQDISLTLEELDVCRENDIEL